MWSIIISAFVIIFGLSGAVALLIPKSAKNTANPIQEYLLAESSLGKLPVISLLFSQSFGINALLYQVWLGYAVGIWALVAQGAWMFGYILLAKHTQKIREVKSLHDILGKSYGSSTRVLAGFCSLIGIMYLLGWEVTIGSDTIGSIIANSGLEEISSDYLNTSLLTIAIVVGAMMYTVIGGLRGNGIADIFLNAIKLFSILYITVVGLGYFLKNDGDFWSHLFPPLERMILNLGWFGLLTHIVFSLSWQFVDNSTWQNIIGGKEEEKGDSSKSVKLSGYLVFIAPGIIGTILGICLHSVVDVTADNVLASVLAFNPGSDLLVFLFFMLIISCIMSMIDGLFLASTFAFVIDILKPNTSIEELDNNPIRANKLLIGIRLILVAFAIIGIWGVKWLMEILDLNLFDFVYIVIITQLALIGPVWFAIKGRKGKSGITIIITSLVIGFLTAILGSIFKIGFLTDGAGTITVLVSFVLSYLLIKKSN